MIFEQDGKQQLGLISGPQNDRYRVLTSSGEEAVLTKARLHKTPGLLPSDCKTNDAKTKFLCSVVKESEIKKVPPSQLWEKFRNLTGSVIEETQFCEKFFGSLDSSNYLATREALIVGKAHFRRDSNGFVPRTVSEVEEYQAKEAERAGRLEAFERCASFLRSKSKDKKLEIPADLEPYIQQLKWLAAEAEISPDMREDAEALLVICERELRVESHALLSERAFNALHKAGIFKRDSNLAILKHRIQTQWSPQALSDAEGIRNKNPSMLNLFDAKRTDLRELHTFTIDDESTRDMDDALSFEQSRDGYTLYIHISDVASAIPMSSTLDLEARRRATSLYCTDITVNMLPETLSHDALSLVQGQERNALSIVIHLSHEFSILGYEITPSVIRNAERLSYNVVDTFLQGTTWPYSKLYDIASSFEADRISSGAIKIQKHEIHPSVSSSGEISLVEIDEQAPSRHLIGELMVLANRLMAEYCVNHQIPCLYRAQDRPDAAAEVRNDHLPQQVQDYLERIKLKRSFTSLTPSLHSTLGLSAYTQVTSPIRRYLDLVLQRQLLAHLAGRSLPYNAESLAALNQEVEDPLQRAQFATRETKRYWMFRYLERYLVDKRPISGTVVRTDTRTPLVEMDEIFLVLPARLNSPKVGARVELNITQVDARRDHIRIEERKSFNQRRRNNY